MIRPMVDSEGHGMPCSAHQGSRRTRTFAFPRLGNSSLSSRIFVTNGHLFLANENPFVANCPPFVVIGLPFSANVHPFMKNDNPFIANGHLFVLVGFSNARTGLSFQRTRYRAETNGTICMTACERL